MVRFIEILSHIEPLTMAAEAPDPHHGGPSRVEDCRNGLTVAIYLGLGVDPKENSQTGCFEGIK